MKRQTPRTTRQGGPVRPSSRRNFHGVFRPHFEPLESRTVLSGSGLVLSELAAAEQRVLQDSDDDWSDWIELQNTSHESLDLSGYHLSDDPAVPSLWTFPPGVSLEAGGHLVVFASGKDTVLGSGELHTNFRLGRDGEAVRLYQPGGATLASQLSFPAQLDDISYGLAPVSREVELVSANNPSAILPDGATHWRVELPFDVTHADALDELWLELSYRGGIVIGLGDVELTRRQTDEGAYREERIPLAAGSGLIDFNAVTNATFAVDLADGTYQVTATLGDLSVARDEMALELEGVEVARLATAAGQFVTRTDEVSVVDGQLSVRLADLGGATARAVINRLSIDGGSLGEPLEFDFGSDASPLAAGAERVTPETVYSPGRGYGWVAGDIRVPTFPPIPPSPLESGENLLWIEATGSLSDFLADVHLVASEPGVDTDRAGFFARPTPGRSNDEWRSQVAPVVDVSRGGGTFLTDFLLELSSNLPGGVIHYTLDGSLPGYGSPIHDPLASLPVAKTMQVRAFASAPGYLAGPIVTHSFVKLATDLENFSSGTPILVIDTFVGFAGGDMDRDGDVDYDDVPVFVLGLNDPDAYRERYGVSAELEGDINNDGRFDTDDVATFVVILADGRPDGQIEERESRDGYWGVFEATEGNRTDLLGPAEAESRAGVRERGSSSSGNAKQPYRIELWDEFDRDLDVEFLDFPSDSDWVLIPQSTFDQSLMSNDFIYELSNQTGRYAVRSRFVELFINVDDGVLSRSDYRGVYSLMENIKRGSERVDVEKLSSNHITEPLISGGYMIKIDNGGPGELGFTGGGQQLWYVDPEEHELTAPGREPQVEYIKNFMDEMATSLHNRDPETGYAAYIDPNSWIDHHLLNVLANNGDSLWKSTYMFKTREGRLEYGPIWDFDRALGSTGPTPRCCTAGWSGYFQRQWWITLFDDPDIRQAYVDRYQELRRGAWSTQNIDAIVDSLAEEITEEAATRNFERWPTGNFEGGWPGEVAELRQWLHDRVAWMDSQMVAEPAIAVDGSSATQASLALNSGSNASMSSVELALPAGASPNAKIYYTLDGSDPRLKSFDVAPNQANLLRDFHETERGTFVVDLEPGSYEVTVWLGDLASERDQITVAIEDRSVTPEAITTAAGGSWMGTYTIDVMDGQLTVQVEDAGGVTPRAALAGVRVRPLEAVDELAFDFGPAGSPVAEGFVPWGEEPYVSDSGFGWINGQVRAFDREVPDDLRQDYLEIQQPSATFAVDLPNGYYSVRLVMGNELAARSDMQIRIEPGEVGEMFRAVSTTLAHYHDEAYFVRIEDGRLSVQLSTPDGSAARAVINALVVTPLVQFDFGTAVSPVEPEFIRVGGPLEYSSARGFGWMTPGVIAVDRTAIADGGGIAATAMLHQGEPILVGPGQVVRARTFDPEPHHLADASQPFFWSAEVVLEVPSDLPPLAITEIHYHPLDPTPEELAALPDVVGSDFEFIEIQNLTGRPLDIEGYSLSGGIQFTFPAATLAAGEHAIVAGRPEAFALRHAAELNVLGEFSGNLSNGGESIQLLAPDTTVVLDFEYDDSEPWPESADGTGPSLELIDPQATPATDYGNADRWQPSALDHGTPGQPPLVRFGGDMDRDGDLDYDDIAAFVLALQDADAYEEMYGVPAVFEGDLNGDGVFDMEDIDELVRLLIEG